MKFRVIELGRQWTNKHGEYNGKFTDIEGVTTNTGKTHANVIICNAFFCSLRFPFDGRRPICSLAHQSHHRVIKTGFSANQSTHFSCGISLVIRHPTAITRQLEQDRLVGCVRKIIMLHDYNTNGKSNNNSKKER